MSLTFQPDNFANSVLFQTVKDALQKKPHDRTDEDVDLISQNIYELKYFRDMVHNESERLEFTKVCAKHLKYEYFPKGMEVIRKGERGDHFYIILRGEAYVFVSKDEAEMQRDLTEEKQKIFNKYKDFLGTIQDFAELNPILSQQNSLAISVRDGRSKSFAFSSQLSTTLPPALSKQESMARVLLGNTRIIRGEEAKHDFTLQEKLLFLNNKPGVVEYFEKDIAAFKKVNCLRTGDSFGELALIFNQPRLASIIASEDLHLLSFTSNDYREVFDSQVQNVMEKIEFFNGIFPTISQPIIAKFCYLLEEKTFKFNDIIYKEGDPADGIYIIKQGEVQLSQIIKQKPTDSPKAAASKRGSIYQRKIVAATLVTGNFFGDIETLKNLRRNYTATSASTTFAYRLKKQSYHSMILPHFPSIANFLKNKAESSEEARQTRMENTIRIQHLALPTREYQRSETMQKSMDEAKSPDNKLKDISLNRRKSENLFPLHFAPRMNTILLKEEDEDHHREPDYDKELGIAVSAIEHVQSQSRPSLFDFSSSKVFALVSPRESRAEPRTLSPIMAKNKQVSEVSNSPNPWFPSPPKVPRLTISNCASPVNKQSSNGSLPSGNSPAVKINLPQLKHRGSFTGLDVEKIADFGFSSLVSRLRQGPAASPAKMSFPSSPRKMMTISNSPTKQTEMDEMPSFENLESTPRQSVQPSKKEKDNEHNNFNKTLAKLIKDKVEIANASQAKQPEKVNFHVRQKMSKLPFKQMKSQSPDKIAMKTSRDMTQPILTQGWKTERLKNLDVKVLKPKKTMKIQGFKLSAPIIDVAQIQRIEHENVVKNELLSTKSVEGKIKKTSHNMFRVFKNVVCKCVGCDMIVNRELFFG